MKLGLVWRGNLRTRRALGIPSHTFPRETAVLIVWRGDHASTIFTPFDHIFNREKTEVMDKLGSFVSSVTDRAFLENRKQRAWLSRLG